MFKKNLILCEFLCFEKPLTGGQRLIYNIIGPAFDLYHMHRQQTLSISRLEQIIRPLDESPQILATV